MSDVTVERTDQHTLAAADPTGRLYNADLAPTHADKRKWNAYSLLALWMSDAHNIGDYTFAGVPVIDGVSAAVKLAEALYALGLSTSKIGTYAPPRPKTIRGWPLHRQQD
ncbi:MAG: hypothetical protein ACRDRN_26785 [Sciscionella sp.]